MIYYIQGYFRSKGLYIDWKEKDLTISKSLPILAFLGFITIGENQYLGKSSSIFMDTGGENIL